MHSMHFSCAFEIYNDNNKVQYLLMDYVYLQ